MEASCSSNETKNNGSTSATATTTFVKQHRRMSSTFYPEQPSLLERTTATFIRATTPLYRFASQRIVPTKQDSLYCL
uniref:Uncharacterized protein n=1 Tax=Syphacia muris TaxID=451379 RepID=A0A0N5AY60_9BILA